MINIETYFKERMKALKLSEKQNFYKVSSDGGSYMSQFFSIDTEKKAIKIHYFTPDGRAQTYLKGKKEVDFYRYRLLEPIENKKYHQDYGSEVYSWFSPKLIEAYKKGQKTKTLIIVEGEFKAFSIDHNLGFPSIGIGGIWNYKDKSQNQLESWIIEVFKVLQPENVIIMHDADARDIIYKEGKDLASRLQSFHSALVNFAELCKPYDFDLYYYQLQDKFTATAKGIDDLISSNGLKPKDIAEEIEKFTVGEKKYFHVLNINTSLYRLKSHFRLDSVSEFYEAYKDIIQDKEFIYINSSYYYDGQKVVSNYLKHAFQYLRIGTDYYKKVWHIGRSELKKPKEKRVPELIIEPWKSGIIKQDHGFNKNFFDNIPKFDRFIFVPDNKNYRRIIEINYNGIVSKYYNRYQPVEHNMVKGEWPTIEKFLRHIGSDKNTSGDSMYNFLLDYLKISYENPKQRLPVVCLVSYEFNTGKSKFLEFLRLIFKLNVTILDNERFTGKFTSHFSDKLFVCLDEGFIPIEQKIMKERIKNFSVGDTMWLEGKGKDAKEIDNYCHLVMTSNDESNFMQIDKNQNRFAVLRVAPFEGKTDPNLLDKMENEISAFLYFLLNEYNLTYETAQSRFSFETKIYETETLLKVQKNTRTKWIVELEQYLLDIFNITDMEQLAYTPTDLVKALNERGVKVLATNIINYLQDELKIYPTEKPVRYAYFSQKTIIMDMPYEENYNKESRVGKVYLFNRSLF
jgi:hypothetical protein